MVSIFAQELYDETITVTLSNGNNALNEINTKWNNFPTVDISTSLGGFTYVETANVTLEMSAPLDAEFFNDFSGRNFSIDARPELIFDGQLNIFGTVGFAELFDDGPNDGPQTVFGGTENNDLAIDKYADTPAELSVNVLASQSQYKGGITIDGNQTLDVTAKISLIGRQP